ncbi:MarR family winged helix-turn-helix transcriptional regulator [Sphingobium sp.]|uniref:MarR family winged helix-turn-helix transcriptional regulator n=1 Tax=Sphingobium sp. TaxID=1912891 RepID=UPI002C6B5D99|nr:MarR family transcriptional regulator [Sphingobium sp.]HUD94434.1 MarR family transcriptional regulator [Sphingobium sp.]
MSKPAVSTDQTLFVRDHCLCLAAQRAARSLSRRFDEAFRSLGLTSGQFSLLNALNRPQPPSVGSVAQLLAMDRTTLTANLKPLERGGLVRPEADPDDRRVRRLVLTEEGRDRLASAMPIWIAVHGEIDAGLIDAGVLRSGLAALR